MTNRGVLRSNERWQFFKPRLAIAGTGGETQPVLKDVDGTTYNNGTYVRDPETNYVTAQMQIAFVSESDGAGGHVDPTIGSGGPYVMRLPVPARRRVEIDANRRCPIPLGRGMCYLSFVAPLINVPVVPMLADKYLSLGGAEDSWIQFAAPYVLSWGTESWSSGTSYTVTHKAGYTPSAYDIEIVQTDTVIASNNGQLVVTATDATTFTVRNRAGTAPSSATGFNWKIRGEPPTGQNGLLVSPTVPFDWTRYNYLGPYPNLFVQFGYEAA